MQIAPFARGIGGAMSYRLGMKRILLCVAVSLTIGACSQSSDPTSAAVAAEMSKARGPTVQPVRPRAANYTPPAPASLSRTDLDNPTVPAPRATSVRPGLTLRIDASSPEALIASLKSAEATLQPRDLDRLRAALTVVQMMMQRKVAALAVADPAQANLSDEQLLKLAFGDINGKTVEEVIDYGIRMTPVVAPDAANTVQP